jgi:hypothetical protein
MEANAVAGIDGIIPTLCTSLKDEMAMKDAVAVIAARSLESNCAVSMDLKIVNFPFLFSP